MLFDRVFIYAWPCMQAQKLKIVCMQSNFPNNFLLLLCGLLACLLAGWLTNKLLKEINFFF